MLLFCCWCWWWWCNGTLPPNIRIIWSGWWFGTWILWFSIYWEFHHPNWLSYFSEGLKPPTRTSFSTQIMKKMMITPSSWCWTWWSLPFWYCLWHIKCLEIMGDIIVRLMIYWHNHGHQYYNILLMAKKHYHDIINIIKITINGNASYYGHCCCYFYFVWILLDSPFVNNSRSWSSQCG